MTVWTMETSGGTSGSLGGPAPLFTVNVKDIAFGAKGDGKRVTDGAMTIGLPYLDSATAGFTVQDVGKMMLVTSAGPSGTSDILQSPVLAYFSPTRVQLAANASHTVSGAEIRWGSDDTDKFLLAFAAAKVSGGKVFIPRGRYFVSTVDCSRFSILRKTQLVVEGEGFQESILQHTGTNVCIYLGGSSYTTWRDMSIDSNGSSKVGVLACRLSDAGTCSHHVFENFGTPIGSVWAKAPFVGISCEETTQRNCDYDNEGGSIGTLFYTNKNTQIAVTAPNGDTIVESSAVANRIVDGSITTANGGAACVTAEYGAEVAIAGRTFLGVIGASTTSVGVRIAGDATIPSYSPVVIGPGCDIEMNSGPAIELKSYSGTNTVAGPVIENSFIPQSAQLITYSGTIITNGLTYEGNSEYQTGCALTLSGTHNFPHVVVSGINASVVLSSGAVISGGTIEARTITDNGATVTATTRRTLTTISSSKWLPVAFNAGNFTADAGTWTLQSGDQLAYDYKILDGDTMVLAATLNATTVAGSPTQLRIAIPAGKTAVRRVDGPASVNDNGAGEVAANAVVLPGGAFIAVSKFGSGAFANSTNATLVRVVATFEVTP